jgi:hypothetical protein
MSMEDTKKRLKDLLSKGASEEEMLKQLTLAEGCGLKIWCQEQIIPATGEKSPPILRICKALRGSSRECN